MSASHVGRGAPTFRPVAAFLWDALPDEERAILRSICERNSVGTLGELADVLVLREVKIERNRRANAAARGVAA